MPFDFRNLTPLHIKAARVLLEWDQQDLVDASRVSKTTIQTIERGGKVMDRTLRDICDALQKEGIEFFNGDAPGVRLHKNSSPLSE